MPEQYHAGRTVGRTIYRDDSPDGLIGCMDTRALAAMVVEALNRQSSLIVVCERLLAKLDEDGCDAVTIYADGSIHHQLIMAVARAKGVI